METGDVVNRPGQGESTNTGDRSLASFKFRLRVRFIGRGDQIRL